MAIGPRAMGCMAIAALAVATAPQAPTCASSEVAPSAARGVFAGHPRLIVGGYRGPSIDDLRDACAAPAMRGECARIGGRHLLDDAMSHLLTGDAAAAARVRDRLLAGVSCGNGYEVTAAGGYAIAYDWSWSTLSAADRTRVEENLAQCGVAIASSLRGNGAHLWHGFGSQAAALALVALALDEDSRRDELLADASELFRGDALEAYAVVGGAWPEGYSYERSHFFSGDPPHQYVMDALRAWHSAVEHDRPAHDSVFETIAAEEGDWLRALGRHFVYGTLDPTTPNGKRTLMRGGDMPTGQAYPYKQYRPFVDAIARAYDDDVLAGWGTALEDDWPFVGGTGTYHSVHRYSLPYTLPVAAHPEPPGSLPLGAIWGRDDLGYVITRSGWSDDATAIGYRAGKWFTGHQHMDQGHIDVWRRGPLAVDAGVYAGWGTDHRESFYSRTVAHNTILVHRDDEAFEGHPGIATVNDDGQRIHTHNRRGCAQCIQSVAEWREHVGEGMHFEAARIEAFEEQDAFTVVASDLTSAYNSSRYVTPGNEPKIDLAQRDLVFVRPSLLLVADRVRTAAGAGRPRFVMHFPFRPLVQGLTVVEGDASNGILVAPSRDFQVSNDAGGTLRGSTLLPTTVEMTMLGGTDYRYWVDGANRTAGSEGQESEPAEPGLWRIEVAPGGDTGGNPDGASDWLLLHALSITDSAALPEDVRLADVTTDLAAPAPVVGVRYDRADESTAFVLMSGSVPRQALQYAELTVEERTRGTLLLTDLVPLGTYALAMGGERVADLKASAEGVAVTRLADAVHVTLGRCPPATGAGDSWRDLCRGTPAPGSSPTPGAPPATATPKPLVAGAFLPLGFAQR